MVATVQQSMRLSASRYPAIIISASGMATGGRVLHHLKVRAPDERNAVVFPGFQVGGSRGARLVAGEREVKIHGEMVPVRAEVRHLQGFSGHADRGELLAWLRHLRQRAAADLRRPRRTRRRRLAARGDPERTGLAGAGAGVRRTGRGLSVRPSSAAAAKAPASGWLRTACAHPALSAAGPGTTPPPARASPGPACRGCWRHGA